MGQKSFTAVLLTRGHQYFMVIELFKQCKRFYIVRIHAKSRSEIFILRNIGNQRILQVLGLF